MKIDRDEVLYIPRDEVCGGFICPNCLGVAVGAKWADHAKYCPECGQHIKIIAQKDFKDLCKSLKGLDEYDFEKVAVKYMGGISGVYKNQLDKMRNNENYIAGQMEISDFL